MTFSYSSLEFFQLTKLFTMAAMIRSCSVLLYFGPSALHCLVCGVWCMYESAARQGYREFRHISNDFLIVNVAILESKKQVSRSEDT